MGIGLKDNAEIQVVINQYGSIKQKDSQRGDGVYYSLDCLVDGRKDSIWGELPFLQALVENWPGANGGCTIERLNKNRYEVTVDEDDEGDLSKGPELATWSDEDGGWVTLEMPDFDAPAPKQSKPKQAKAETPAKQPQSRSDNGQAKKPVISSTMRPGDLKDRYGWALGASMSLWNETYSRGLGESWEPDNDYWANVRNSATTLFIQSMDLPKSAFEDALGTVVDVMDGEVVAEEEEVPF